jgi:2-succinyl-5-enolpyruvyl-6-hydroxy-3-cyclohexene-1-carboxylate synthase
MSHAWCRRLLEGLAAAGVKDLVVSPGSRSTPLLLAAIDSPLQLHSVIDERSAAFFALGRARAESAPVAFLCTSGSAGAHALPALLEARYAGHRVVAITADRPPELHACGANQTIDQRLLFAAACPPCLETGVPESSEEAELGLRRRVQQAVALSAGPVHINMAFRKPLEPSKAELATPLSGPPPAALWRGTHVADEAVVQRLAALCSESSKGLIVAGPSVHVGQALQDLATATGFVLLAESTSGARLTGTALPQRCDAFPHVLSNDALADELSPDLLLRFGAQPACTALNRWLARLEEEKTTEFRFCGNTPMSNATGASQLVMGDIADVCERLARSVSPTGSTDYLQRWRQADEEAWSTVASCIDESDHDLSEARAMATILQSLPAGSRLTLGNSMPVRSADMVMPGHLAALEVLHQRGTSGIDGLIAGAIGSSSKEPGALLIGDVSCSHDLSSLALAPLCRGPLAVIVIDNQGGQIFSHLPIAAVPMDETSREFWRTKPSVDFERACSAYQVPYRRASNNDELQAALSWSLEQSSCAFVHVCVAPESMLSFSKQAREDADA